MKNKSDFLFSIMVFRSDKIFSLVIMLNTAFSNMSLLKIALVGLKCELIMFCQAQTKSLSVSF